MSECAGYRAQAFLRTLIKKQKTLKNASKESCDSLDLWHDETDVFMKSL